ncbi:MAG: hypothetical protein WD772_09170, partial [Pseudohongiellaceae bacterium]
ARFDADPGQFCRPDFQIVRALYLMLGEGRLQPTLEEILADPVPSPLSDNARLMLPGPPVNPQ